MIHKHIALLAIAATFVAACEPREKILPGKRISLAEMINGEDPTLAAEVTQNVDAVINLPAQRTNSDWAQSIGSPATRTIHPALRATPVLAWSADIGTKSSRRARIVTDPVVGGGRVFTMDADSNIYATSTAGATQWTYALTPETEKAGQAIGGGFAYSDGRLYATTGYGRLVVLDAASGQVIWEQRLNATATGAPTVMDGLVYLVAGDNTAWAIDIDDGRIEWQIDATTDVNNVLGAAAPALNDQFAVFSYGNGGVEAAFRKGGFSLWNASLTGERKYRAISKVTDITGDPVIDGNTVYVGNYSGRLVSLKMGNGERNWTAREGAVGPVWPVGGSLFLVSDANQLLRLDAATGERIWGVDLPSYKKLTSRKRDAAYGNFGPVLAGGRVWVASGDGQLRGFDPRSGVLLASLPIPDGATSAPVVAGGTMYVVGRNGKLHAFR